MRSPEAVAAGGASDAIFDGAVVVPFLLYYRIVVDDVAKAVFRNVTILDGNDSLRVEEANELIYFGAFPHEAIRAVFC
jgi:hypothetical protein